VLVLRFEGHTQEAHAPHRGEMLALLRSVKPTRSRRGGALTDDPAAAERPAPVRARAQS
jgi:hypothetical protein